MNPRAKIDTAHELSEQVALACRILASHGYKDLTLGHVSARQSTEDTVMHIKRKGASLDEIEPRDVVSFDIDENLQANSDMHLEAVLHTEVYKRRPEVCAVVHGHPPYATALGATSARLEFLTHDATLFKDGVATYDDVPDLIIEPEQGVKVAEALGNNSVLLLRNHGVLVVGKDLPWAVLTAITLERAVELQAIASTLGPLRPVSQSWASHIHKMKYQDQLVEEYWHAWIRELHREGKAFGVSEAE